ncbi:cytochrome P450 [Earliella scabrosa]|nr:cytochrome P450 [Earliella scabrosa]
MEYTSPQVYAALIGLTTYLLYRWYRHPLRSIPAVGSTLPILSYGGAFRFLRDAQQVLQEGCAKYHGRAFRVATLDGWVVVLSGSDLVEELRRRPDDEFSFKEGAMSSFHLDYTLTKENDLHVEVIRDRLTRNLPLLATSLSEEIAAAFDTHFPESDTEWTAVPALDFSRKVICQVTNRAFVGVPTCRDTRFIDLASSFRTGVVVSGSILTLVPSRLRWLVGPLLRRVKNDVRRASGVLAPIIERHRKRASYTSGGKPAERADSVLQWLAEDRSLTAYAIAERTMLMNLASVDPAANALTSALYYLGESPSLVEALRDEVRPIIESQGWSMAAFDKMLKVDSFLKESQRLNTDFLTFIRKAKKDVTLSDGSRIPAGTVVAVASESAHLSATKYGPDPAAFDPFRFARMRAEAGQGPQHQWVNTSADYLAFGYGRHAYPGRFFATAELKATLAHLVLRYDVTLAPATEGSEHSDVNVTVRPENVRLGPANLPSMTAKVLFRRRHRPSTKSPARPRAHTSPGEAGPVPSPSLTGETFAERDSESETHS